MRLGLPSVLLMMSVIVACAPAAAPSPTAAPAKPAESKPAAPAPAASPAAAPAAAKPAESPVAAKPAESPAAAAAAKPAASPATAPAAAPAASPAAAAKPATAKPANVLKTTALELNPTPDPIVAFIDDTQDLGLFTQNGLEVDIKRAGGGGPAKVQALVAGEADVAVSDIIAGFSATYEGTDVRAIFVSSARYGWVVASKQKYTAPEQLKGQQIGVPSLGGSSRFGGTLTFKAFGVADSDVQWQAIGGTTQLLQAQFAGRTEAVVISPMAIPLLKGPEAADTKILVENSAQYTPPFPNFVILARNSWVEANPEAADRYVKSFLDASRQLAKDKAAFTRLTLKYFPDLTQADAEGVWQNVTEQGYWAENGGINYAATQGLLDVYFEVRGDKPNDKLAKAADVYNTAPLKRVLDRERVLAESRDQPDWYRP
jgi:ABC-type nitrate/sulfonate/bicarbonate transport system substrate-binding protein